MYDTQTEIEFVCHNSRFIDSTPIEKMCHLYNEIYEIEGALTYFQDFSTKEETQISMATIISDKDFEHQIKDTIIKKAEEVGVEVDQIKNQEDWIICSRLKKATPYHLVCRVKQ